MHDRIHVPRGDGSHVTPRAGLEGPHQGKTVGKGTEGARQPRMFGSELTPELSLSTVDAAQFCGIRTVVDEVAQTPRGLCIPRFWVEGFRNGD